MSKRVGIASIAMALAIALLASGSFYNQAYAEEALGIQIRLATIPIACRI